MPKATTAKSAKAPKTPKAQPQTKPPSPPETNQRTPGETIKPKYGQIDTKWHLLNEDGTPQRELTSVEVLAAIETGLITVTLDPVFKPVEPEAPAPVEALPVAVKAPRKEGSHCAICLHYSVPKGEHPLNCDTGVCVQTNTEVKADNVCAAFRMNEGLRD